MKYKLLFLITLFLIFSFSFKSSYSQKFHILYKVENSNNDSLVFRYKALSDEKLQKKFTESFFNKKSADFNATTIRDNINRKFEKVSYNNNYLFVRVLNEGYINLYSYYLDKTIRYIVISPTDTLEIEKLDKIEGTTYKNDNRYMGILGSLAKDFPEIAIQAQKVKFKNSSIQSYISNLNGKYTEKENLVYIPEPYLNYLHLGIMVYQSSASKNYVISAIRSLYKLDGSVNTSLRFGLAANYAEYSTHTSEVWYEQTITDDISTHTTRILLQPAYTTSFKNKYLELPFLINFEVTSWFLTPYAYFGFAPMFFDQNEKNVFDTYSLQYHTGVKFAINLLGGMGLKVKPTKNVNIMAELKSDLACGSYIVFGMDYAFKLNKH